MTLAVFCPGQRWRHLLPALLLIPLLLTAAMAAEESAASPPQTVSAEQLASHLAVMQPLAAPWLAGSLQLTLSEDDPALGKRARLHWQAGLFRLERDWLGLPECYGYDGTDYWYGSCELLPLRLDHMLPADVSHHWACALYYCAPAQQAWLRPLTAHELAEAAQLPQLAGSLLIAWTPPDMSEVWLLLDPATLLLRSFLYGDQRQLEPSGVIKLCVFGEWIDFSAARYPASYELLTLLSDGSELRRRPARVLAIEPVAEALPPPAFSLTSAPPVVQPELPGGELRLPFRLHDDDVVLDALGPDGQPLVLKFDSGANIGLLRRDVATRLGWTPAGALPVSGHGRSAELQLLRASGVRLGGVELGPYACGVAPAADAPLPGQPGYGYHAARIAPDDNSLDARLREDGVDGLLGTALLNSFVVRIDYAGGLLTLYSAASFDAARDLPPGQLELPLWRDSLPYTEVTVDGQLHGGAFFNTGARPYFNLALWALDKQGIEYPLESIATGLGIHGTQVFGIIRPNVVELGTLRLEQPYTFLESLAPGDEPEEARMASFGSEFFHDHAVTFDLQRERVYIRPY